MWAAARRAIDVLAPCRFAIFVLAAVGVALGGVEQGRETLRVLAEFGSKLDVGGDEPYILRLTLFVFATATLAASSWYFSRQALLLEPPPRPVTLAQERLFRWLPRVLGGLGFAVPAAALAAAAGQYPAWQRPWLVLCVLAAALLVVSVAFLVFLARRRAIFPIGPLEIPERSRRLRTLPATTQRVLAASAAVTVVLFLLILFDPIGLTAYVSTPSVILYCASIWVFAGTVVVVAAARVRLPLMTLLFVLLLASSWTNDNHRVRPSRPSANRPTLEEATAAWVSRMDAMFPAERRHPVFVVAAEGGGLRAAYWTAGVLASLQGSYLSFLPHCFAISAVSGGSVGAAVFATLDASGAHDFRDSSRRILSHDFLAPTIARLLGSDLPQQFVPVPIFPDRGAAMESAFEHAWRKEGEEGKDAFARPFLDLANDHRPLLFLNATDVGTGRRVIFAPVRIVPRRGRAGQAVHFNNALDGIDMLGGDLPVSAAVHMSARFTYVSPAGTIRASDGLHRLVDGGYFENSGAATASEIVAFLRSERNPARDRLDVHVIVVSHREKPLPGGVALSEELAPVRALLAARVARGEHAVDDLRDLAGPDGTIVFGLSVDGGVPLPLGWLLSAQARRAIDHALDSKWNSRSRSRVGAVLTGLAPDAPRNLVPDAFNAAIARRKAAERSEAGLAGKLQRFAQAR